MDFSEEAKVLISTMDRQQAEAFVIFLHTEIVRHARDIEEAKELIEEVKRMFNL